MFCSGHDLAEVAETDLPAIRSLLGTCTELMTLMQQVPQPVVARVHGLATAAGCQLVASADLAVASEDAGFATPGGKGGWFCHTPMVAVARNVGRKRAMELAMSGDVIDARTALDWGLVNQVVPAGQLDSAVQDLLERVTRGSAESKGIGKQALYAQIDLDQPKAYAYAVEVMASTSQLPDAREWMRAFLEKRKPRWRPRPVTGRYPALSSAWSSAFIHGPRSSGVRAEMRLPSTTVTSSTQSVPALIMSSRIAATLVARRPLRIFAEIGTQPAWQMNATGLPASSKSRTRPRTAAERRSLSGAYPPGMTSPSNSWAVTWSTTVSTGTGPCPFLPMTG